MLNLEQVKMLFAKEAVVLGGNDGVPLYRVKELFGETAAKFAAGIKNVILRSDKPEAKDFKRWVTHEVLPSIRRTGAYASPAMTPAQLLAAQAQVLVDMERRMNDMQDQAQALETKVDNAIKAFSRPARDHWKEEEKDRHEIPGRHGADQAGRHRGRQEAPGHF